MIQKYEWSQKDAQELSDFLTPMLNYVPEKRATAAQCLKHPWLQQESNSEEEKDEQKSGKEEEENLTEEGDNKSNTS